MNKEQKVRQRLSEFKPIENRGYSIYEVGNLGGNDKERNKIYFVSFTQKNGNYRLVTIFNKIYAFSFLILWCYICISKKSYISLVILVPVIFFAIRNF